MKKIFTLIAAAMFATGAWADDTVTKNFSSATVGTVSINSSTDSKTDGGTKTSTDLSTEWVFGIDFLKGSSSAWGVKEAADGSDIPLPKEGAKYVGGNNTKSGESFYIISTEEYGAVSKIALYLCTTDKGKTSLRVVANSSSDFTGTNDTLLAATTFNALGATTNKAWRKVEITPETNTGGYLKFEICGLSSSGKKFAIDSVSITSASTCAATAPGNINKGELTAGSITLTVTGSPESGDAWYWQSAANGELKTDEYDAVNGKIVSVAGTYYIRSYNASGDCWSVAKSITLTANDFKEHYAVTYNKGAYGTGSIEAGEKIQGEDFTLSSSRFTRDGYVQVGWATTDGGEKAYNLGDTYTTDAAITLYPVWLAAESYSFSYTGAKTISALEAEGWTFNSAIFDADPTDTEAYVNLVSAMNTAKLTAPKSNDMEDNAIAFAKNTGAFAKYDIGKTVKVVALNATLYGGSSSAFNETIEYIGADGSTVKKTYTNSLSAGNWAANSISKNEAVEDVRYIKIYGSSKWVVMSAFSIAYVSKYTINFAAGDGEGTMDPVQVYAGNDVELPASTFTAPTNKVFDAWTSSDVTIIDGEFTMPAKNVTVTATYTNATGVDNTADEAKAVKFIENGVLIIEKNGVRYNAQGQVVR